MSAILRLGACVVALIPWSVALLGWDLPALWEVFRPLCHQEPERSLSFDGVQMLICSRCAGIYLGVALGVWSPFRVVVSHVRVLIVLALIVMSTHVALQHLWLGVHHPVRLATGLLLGGILGAFLSEAIRSHVPNKH